MHGETTSLVLEVPADSRPRHIAIIMDGNGRWAQMRGLPRQEGHRRGLEVLRRTVRNAADLGIRVLTLYSFSTENWRRPITEVSFLMGLLRRFVENDLAELNEAGVRVRIIGSREDLAGWLGVEPRAFSYPFGVPDRDVDASVEKLAGEIGYELAVVNAAGTIGTTSRRLALPRHVAPDVSGSTIVRSLHQILGK